MFRPECRTKRTPVSRDKIVRRRRLIGRGQGHVTAGGPDL